MQTWKKNYDNKYMLTAHVDLQKKLDRNLHFDLPRDKSGGILGPADILGFGAQTPQLVYNSNYTTPSGGTGNYVTDYLQGNPSNNVNGPSYGNYNVPKPTNLSPSGGGGGGGGGDGGNGLDALAAAINDAYNSNNNFINQQEATLNSQQQSILGDINAQVDTSKGVLGNNLATTQGTIDVAQQGGEQRKQDALTAATRLYNELVQGGQQRFGGASSAGEAYQALAGRELQRNNQQTQTDFSTFMGQITQARVKVQNDYDNSVAQLEQQRQAALNQANRDFQSKLLEIQNARNQNNQWKAQSQLAALTDYRNQIFQINLATAENNQNLVALKTQTEQQLESAVSSFGQQAQSAQSGQQAFASGAGGSTNPNTALTYAGTSGAQQGYSPTGQASSQPNNTRPWWEQSLQAFA